MIFNTKVKHDIFRIVNMNVKKINLLTLSFLTKTNKRDYGLLKNIAKYHFNF